MTFRRLKPLNASSLVSRAEGISTIEHEDGIFLVNSKGGRLYRLNSSGTAIWTGLSVPIRVDDLCRMLASEFSVASVAIEGDVVELLSKLHQAGLVLITVVE